MTREEMDFIGGMNMCDEISNEAYKKIMCHCEEQEPVLDKIRAELIAISEYDYIPTRNAMEIIDKYRGEEV